MADLQSKLAASDPKADATSPHVVRIKEPLPTVEDEIRVAESIGKDAQNIVNRLQFLAMIQDVAKQDVAKCLKTYGHQALAAQTVPHSVAGPQWPPLGTTPPPTPASPGAAGLMHLFAQNSPFLGPASVPGPRSKVNRMEASAPPTGPSLSPSSVARTHASYLLPTASSRRRARGEHGGSLIDPHCSHDHSPHGYSHGPHSPFHGPPSPFHSPLVRPEHPRRDHGPSKGPLHTGPQHVAIHNLHTPHSQVPPRMPYAGFVVIGPSCLS